VNKAILNTASMNNKFYDFIEVLRDANVPISTDEVLSLFNAISLIKADEITVFRQTLQTTLIKDYTDIPVFEKCFSDFFLRDGKITPDNMTRIDQGSESIPDNMMDELDDLVRDFLDSLSTDIYLKKTRNICWPCSLKNRWKRMLQAGWGLTSSSLKNHWCSRLITGTGINRNRMWILKSMKFF